MRYRIIENKAGKFKVQSSPMIYSRWGWFLNLFRPLAWHDRGRYPYVNCHSLNWSGEEWDTLEEAKEFTQQCWDYDIQTQKKSDWTELLSFTATGKGEYSVQHAVRKHTT